MLKILPNSADCQLDLWTASTARPADTSDDHRRWLDWLHASLPEPTRQAGAPVVLDLFAGCGGLGLGFEAAGCRTIGYEAKDTAASTYRDNLGECETAFLEVGQPEGSADVLIGGPPCQPFSQIGYQRGKRDPRDGFPIFLDAVQRIRPKIAIIENVRGLLFRNKDYLRQAVAELERFGYQVDVQLLAAWQYGVPQKRERVVVVASTVGWAWPEAAVSDPITAGTALGDTAAILPEDGRLLTASMDKYIAAYEAKSKCVRPRDLHLDQPSRTVTCRNLGAATSDMLRIKLPDGRRRFLTPREGARLQSFPDWYTFRGNAYDQCEQIGNAVPPLLSLALARQVVRALGSGTAGVSRQKKKEETLLDGSTKQLRVEETLTILREAGVAVRDFGTSRAKEKLALCLLAIARMTPETPWADAWCWLENETSGKPMRTRDILRWHNEHWGENRSMGSYDLPRRDEIQPALIPSGLVMPGRATADTNDGQRGYTLTREGAALLRAWGTDDWDAKLKAFRASAPLLRDRLAKAREFAMVPVKLPDGTEIRLSSGKHNELQKAVIEEMLPRFAPGAELLYIGDTTAKALSVAEQQAFDRIGLRRPERGDRLPDIVAYLPERNWLLLIEAFNTSNPINEARHRVLERLTASCTAGPVYVTAFLNRSVFAKQASKISWETEVWTADEPEHMIHYNGDRFLGPHVKVSRPAA